MNRLTEALTLIHCTIHVLRYMHMLTYSLAHKHTHTTRHTYTQTCSLIPFHKNANICMPTHSLTHKYAHIFTFPPTNQLVYALTCACTFTPTQHTEAHKHAHTFTLMKTCSHTDTYLAHEYTHKFNFTCTQPGTLALVFVIIDFQFLLKNEYSIFLTPSFQIIMGQALLLVLDLH